MKSIKPYSSFVSETDSRFKKIWTWLAIILIAGIFISPDSFWIDEGNTAYRAMQPDLLSWFSALTTINGSDAQMPGYMLYVWVWQKFSGNSEFALRMSNLPWLFLIIFALRRFPMAVIVALTSPFILNYLNELRPYLMQIAGASVAVNGISRLTENARSGWRRILAGCLIMCASSLLGVLWSLGALVYVITEEPSRLKFRWFWQGCLMFFPAFGALGTYYAWTLIKGQGAALMGGKFVVSLAAATYELLGLAGLGPEKVKLRIDPQSLLEYSWCLVPAALLCGGTILWSLSRWYAATSRKQVAAAACGIGIPILLLLILVILKDFRVLGRHLAPMVILLVLLIGKAATTANSRFVSMTDRLTRISVLLVITLGIASSLSLRFAPRHRKDDYRGAVAIARDAIIRKIPVLWVADEWTAYFYGMDQGQIGWKPWRNNMPLPVLNQHELVIVTKPDIYDSKGELHSFLMERGFITAQQLPAFTVFEHPKSSALSQ